MDILTLDHHWHPSRVPSNKLMVVLHGRGDSYEGFLWLPQALDLPDLNYLMVNAPDPYYTGYSWYDLPPRQGPGIFRSRSLLDALFAEILVQGISPRDIVLFGFSQGCLMALEWGGRSDLPLAGIVGVSGYVYDPPALLAEMSRTARERRCLITHGTEDEVLACGQTDAQIAHLQRAGMPIQYQRFSKGHTIDPVREMPVIREFVRECFQAGSSKAEG